MILEHVTVILIKMSEGNQNTFTNSEYINQIQDLLAADDIFDFEKSPLNAFDDQTFYEFCILFSSFLSHPEFKNKTDDYWSYLFHIFFNNDLHKKELITRICSAIVTRTNKQIVINSFPTDMFIDFCIQNESHPHALIIIQIIIASIVPPYTLDEIKKSFQIKTPELKQLVIKNICLSLMCKKEPGDWQYLYDISSYFLPLSIEDFENNLLFDITYMAINQLINLNEEKAKELFRPYLHDKQHFFHIYVLFSKTPIAIPLLLEAAEKATEFELLTPIVYCMKKRKIPEDVFFNQVFLKKEELQTPIYLDFPFPISSKILDFIWNKYLNDNLLYSVMIKHMQSIPLIQEFLIGKLVEFTQDPETKIKPTPFFVTLISVFYQASSYSYSELVISCLIKIYGALDKTMSSNDYEQITLKNTVITTIDLISSYTSNFGDIITQTAEDENNKFAAYSILEHNIRKTYDFIIPERFGIEPHKPIPKNELMTINYTFQNNDYSIDCKSNSPIQALQTNIAIKHKLLQKDMVIYSQNKQISPLDRANFYQYVEVFYPQNNRPYIPFSDERLMNSMKKKKIIEMLYQSLITPKEGEDFKTNNMRLSKAALKVLYFLPSVHCEQPVDSLLQCTNCFSRKYHLLFISNQLKKDKIFSKEDYEKILSQRPKLRTKGEKKLFYSIIADINNKAQEIGITPFQCDDNCFNDLMEIGLNSNDFVQTIVRLHLVKFVTTISLYKLFETLPSRAFIIIAKDFKKEPDQRKEEFLKYFYTNGYEEALGKNKIAEQRSDVHSIEKRANTYAYFISVLLTKNSELFKPLITRVLNDFDAIYPEYSFNISTHYQKAAFCLIFRKYLKLTDEFNDEMIKRTKEVLNYSFNNKFYPQFAKFLKTILSKPNTESFKEQIQYFILMECSSNKISNPLALSLNSVSNNLDDDRTGGLVNNGSTCYINATIRALFTIKPFVNMFLSTNFEEPWQLDLQAIYGQMLLSDIKNVQTSDFCSSFLFGGKPINITVQEDAAEFMEELINKLPYEFVQLFRGTIVDHTQKTTLSSNSPQSSTEMTDIFTMLWLQFNAGDQIEAMIENTFFEEIITDDKNDVIIHKNSTVIQKPQFLIVALKRFEFDQTTGRRYKKTEEVNVNLHITKPDNYTMIAAISHTGTVDTGHFTVYVPNGDEWIEYSDTVITTKKSLNQKGVYIVIYKKDDIPPETDKYITIKDISRNVFDRVVASKERNYIKQAALSPEICKLTEMLSIETMMFYYLQILAMSYDKEKALEYSEKIFIKSLETDTLTDIVKYMHNNSRELFFPVILPYLCYSSPVVDFISEIIEATQNELFIDMFEYFSKFVSQLLPYHGLEKACKMIYTFFDTMDPNNQKVRNLANIYFFEIVTNLQQHYTSSITKSIMEAPNTINAIVKITSLFKIESNIHDILKGVVVILATNQNNENNCFELLK